jgi:hypothetical protein
MRDFRENGVHALVVMWVVVYRVGLAAIPGQGR